MPIFDEEMQKEKLEEIRAKEQEDLAQILSKKYRLPYADLSTVSIKLDYLKLIPEEKARSNEMAVFYGSGRKIKVAVKNPMLESTQNLIKEMENNDYEVETFLVSSASLKKAWAKYKEIPIFAELSKGTVDISQERMEEFLSQITTLEKLNEMVSQRIHSRENRKISELLEIILSGALSMDASDIHLEPYEKLVKLRLRLDGVLHPILDIEPKAYQFLLSRIKLISEMKLNIREKAQDGRFSIKWKETEIEVRSSILPGPYGESVVLRVLNPKSINVEFEDLGMSENLKKIMQKEIKKSTGMILTTGPTGSGKTTTLYAFLKKISNPEIKIITIEEPIEYHLNNITQSQTNSAKGYTFANALRAILRQDPDVVMVGEIRDLEAASIALNAALTGHLVFSTLHTNDAAGTIPRLIDLGANPSIMAPAINVSMAQRLIRKLCPSCKVETEPTTDQKKTIEKILASFPEQTEKPDVKKIKIFLPGGRNCEKCNGIGYKGRMGLFEAILIDDEMEKLIMKRPSEMEIREMGKKQGILNMAQDGILKIIQGMTSIEEIARVIEL